MTAQGKWWGKPHPTGMTSGRGNGIWGHKKTACAASCTPYQEWWVKNPPYRVRTPEEKKVYERQIVAVDGQIDRAVYELYGLGEEEIGMVEGREEK